jgi:hypothetical protein
MRFRRPFLVLATLLPCALATTAFGCSDSGGGAAIDAGPPTDAAGAPEGGNPDGKCAIPSGAGLEDVTHPTTVVGDGTPASCTSAAVVAAIAKGGIVTFSCGPDPLTIELTETAKIFNDKGPKIVIDGGGKITLSGGNKRRILYQNTCDQKQVWTSSHCQDQDSPQLTVQNLTFVDGNSTGETVDGGGGGAIFVRGGRFKIVSSRFFHNQTDPSGSDVGGGAVRVLSQYQGQPVYVVNSTFGGSAALGNFGANGGGLSSIGVSYTVLNSYFSGNLATGHGASSGSGGNGGAIYNDGDTFTLTVCGTRIEDNHANEGGGAIFFVSNNRTGTLVIQDSTLARNPSDGFETTGLPGIFYLGKGDPQISGSTLTK